MKMTLLFSFIILLSTSSLSFKAAAEYSCSLDLRKGVATSRNHVRILEADRTVLQINNARQLFIAGKLQELDKEQAELLEEYAKEFHIVVPEITLLAKEGVGLVTDNITRVYSGLMGRNSDSTEELYESMKKVKMRVKEKFGRTANYHFINPGKLEDQDERIPRSLQEQIETGFSNVSGIITAIGTFDTPREAGIADKEDTTELRIRARIICDRLHKLNKVETQLHEQVVALSPYDVIIDRRLD